MRAINWFGYYPNYDGYGRFNARLAEALSGILEVHPYHIGVLEMPPTLLEKQGIQWENLSISCCPPYMLHRLPSRHWLYSMTEGSRIPDSWVRSIEKCNIERVLVPCEHNAKAFRESGVTVPVSVIPGGTDPEEFPVIRETRDYRPYRFITFADRGFRKGWEEVRRAFYLAFGGKTTGEQRVRLIIKARKGNTAEMLEMMDRAEGKDPRVIYQVEDALSPYSVLAQAHCLVLPSRSEGWGMIQREAACMGLPVITQAYAGLDDGFTHEWAMVVKGGEIQPIPRDAATMLGEWQLADLDDLAQKMRYCFYSPETAAGEGRRAAQWIRKNQTWEHSAQKLAELIRDGEEGTGNGLSLERAALSIS